MYDPQGESIKNGLTGKVSLYLVAVKPFLGIWCSEWQNVLDRS